jgi:Tfp pilus assembly protein PilF
MFAKDARAATEALYATAHWLQSEGRTKDAASVFRAMVVTTPRDERGWLGLGLCHEKLGQEHIALEMYGTGRVMARPAPRCELARARVYRTQGESDKADEALENAEHLAEQLDDDALRALVVAERR